MEREALKLALEVNESVKDVLKQVNELIAENKALKEALAQPAQEPVAYDKTEMNGFVQDLYDKKMQEGKHGHYETMFHVVHQAIKRATPPQRKPLTVEEVKKLIHPIVMADLSDEMTDFEIVRAIEAAHGIKEKNNG